MHRDAEGNSDDEQPKRGRSNTGAEHPCEKEEVHGVARPAIDAALDCFPCWVDAVTMKGPDEGSKRKRKDCAAYQKPCRSPFEWNED